MGARVGVLLLLATGCEQVFGLDTRPDAGAAGRDIPHVPAAAEHVRDELLLVEGTTIDTTTGALVPPLAAVEVSIVPQDGGGPELMILHVGELDLMGVTVTGTRPLVILGRRIRVGGRLDASARLDVPGPGGGAAVADKGDNLVNDDSGGGGGGFAAGAARGGGSGVSPSCSETSIIGGLAGGPFGAAELLVLEAGGSGGAGSESGCPGAAGGGGGGAIQLSALDLVLVDAAGVIDASGGGGRGGIDCNADNDGGSGGGGGSGGAIYLDAPNIVLQGAIVANGGAGGAGGCGNAGPGGDGADGSLDGQAVGGAPVPPGTCSRLHGAGGAGATGAAPATTGVDIVCGNGGGGGASVGRIVLHGRQVTGAGVQSPTATVVGF